MKTLAGVFILAVATAAFQEQNEVEPAKRQRDERVWSEGRLVCIGCTLAREYGVDAQCTLHTRHALGFLDQDGRLWTLVDNLRGHGVITNSRLRDQSVRVYGWTYPEHRYLELWRYALPDDGEWIDWDFCKTCGWEVGDHGDEDLCPDCADGP
jgi:hypothetical protein